MKITIMGPSLERQGQIDRKRLEITRQYPALWKRLIAEWKAPEQQDRAWLTYSANYLFRTGNIRWGIDPLTFAWRVAGAAEVDTFHDLQDLSFVLLTHRHEDHLDLHLISTLCHLPVRWVVPEFLLGKVMGQAGLARKKIIVPHPLRPFELDGLNILPFEGLHWEHLPDGSSRGVPAMAYLVELSGRRWLFPGDTRTYAAGRLPDLGRVDVLFAHLWLGRQSAQMAQPPLLAPFCRFCADLAPGRVVVTHLEEWGRAASDFWDQRHFELVRAYCQKIAPKMQISAAFMGESVTL